MINVSGLNKWYGSEQALHDLSFDISKGEIVGFLGPNGAGKSTTMKILTGYMPPTSGKVTIAGHNVVEDSLAVRKRIGYLPENNPLYFDFRVEEFLRYILEVRQVPKANHAKLLDRAVDITSLEKVFYKGIGALSKGYRQRVGLAAALIHDPDILILDEPTSGLDPLQIKEIRDLIGHIGKSHTVLLSTHIMQEVKAMCDRVMVIHQGRIVASDTVSNLEQAAKGNNVYEVVIHGAKAEVTKALSTLKGVHKVSEETRHDLNRGEHLFQVTTEGNADIRKPLFDLCVEHKWALLENSPSKANLEDVFVQLTQEA